ncbi:putative NRPS-like protein biosynthetic cluster [Sporothrix bragantina]|uniref:NRPS-like protein biosynthetic cluster n=1 Tax=Sporothrix bragantina TaxID=671064 RepID=A0ABP0CNV6_9PEZI
MASSTTNGHMDQYERVTMRLEALAKSDAQVAAVVPDDRVTRAIQEPGISLQQVISTVLAGYSSRPALGVRSYDVQDGVRRYHRHFETISYAQLANQAEAISAVWRSDPRFRVSPEEFVACVVFTGAEYAAVDVALVYSHALGVPIQANLASDAVVQIMKDTAPAAMVADIAYLDVAIDYAVQQDSVRSVIVINADKAVNSNRAAIDEAKLRLQAVGRDVAVATFSELVQLGQPLQWTPLPPRPDGPDALSMLLYTSGSTGTPKGAQIHEGILLMFWTEIKRYMPTILVADAPVNHWMGRVEVINALATGGTVYFTLKSDLSTFVEDVQTVRPTYMQILPRFAEIVYQTHLSDVQTLVQRGMDEARADSQMREKLQGYLGDRLVYGVIGSSPTAPEVKQFFRDTFDMAVIEGYGSTESSGSATTVNNRINTSLVIDYRLHDVPELGYYTTDKPYPRGELVVKTRHQFKGYFKRPDATASVFTDDGYVLTGDIMEQRGEDTLVWLDRRNNVIKLSQAEFVAITPVENAYLGDNPLIKQIYVYGNSLRAYLLAVVVPDVDYAKKLLSHDNPSDKDLRGLVLSALRERAHVMKFRSFEVPRDVIIEREPFSLENGLLSSVRKILRPNLRRRYGEQLEAMYEDMDRLQREELIQVRDGSSNKTTHDRVAAAFKASLGLTPGDAAAGVAAARSYRDLGGDSLGATSLAKLLNKMFDLPVPVSILLGPNGNVSEVTRYIESSKVASEDSHRPTFVSVHGKDNTQSSSVPSSCVVKASSLNLPAFFPETKFHPQQQTRVVLLTGATGFLGRFLLLEWMQAIAPRSGKVVAIVRAADADTARRRIDEAFGSLDKDLLQTYNALANSCLEVVAGDLAVSQFGQSSEQFARLAQEVDHIVHPGALVNHRLSYSDLFEPNVVGTAELIRLALTGRPKRFDFVSTVGVPYSNAALLTAPEQVDVRVHAPQMPCSDDYAAGYAASKWAGEVLLRDAHERYGLTVTILRPNMILAHSKYHGQVNVPDMFTRLLGSIVNTGLAPVSFYKQEADGKRAVTHYDGLPVDFVAKMHRQIGDSPSPSGGFRIYNTVNLHFDDGISYDTYVDWIQSAGYKIKRLPDHAEWYRRFTDKLRNLSDAERKNSSLGIVEHFAEPYATNGPVVRTGQFEEIVGGPSGVPHVTEAFIHKYLASMVDLGIIAPPHPCNGYAKANGSNK